MPKTKPNTQVRKTVEQRKRMLEGKPDMPRQDGDGNMAADSQRKSRPLKRSARRSEYPVSRGGMNQESHHHKPAPRDE
jgi:hypothetical protein